MIRQAKAHLQQKHLSLYTLLLEMDVDQNAWEVPRR